MDDKFRNQGFSRKKFLSLVIVLLVLASIPLTILTVSQSDLRDSRGRANLDTDANVLTNQLFEKTNTTDKTIVSQRRKEKMKKLAKDNPEKFLESALDSETKRTLPTLTKNSVEEEIEKTGYINLKDMESEKEEYIFAEISNNDELLNSYDFRPSKKLKKKIEIGTKVKVKGYILDGTFIPYKISKDNVLQAQDEITEEHKIAIIPVNFSDKDNQDYTKTELQNRFFNDSNSVAKYYDSISFGKIKITGKVFDPVKINWSASELCKRSDFLFYALRYPTEDADKKVEARGESLDGYQHRAYIFPRLGPTPINTASNPCTFVAQATIGNQTSPSRNFSRMMVNGHYFQVSLISRTTALIHEMGHNLGLGHADTISCGNKSIDFYGTCTDGEYGDHSDIMGFQYHYFPQTGGHNKYKLGFIPDSNLKIVNSIGTTQVDLYTSSKASTNTQLIRIPRRNIGDAYFIDFRQPVGFDKNLPASVTNGAMIKVGPTNKFPVRNNTFKTFLVDTNPGGNPASALTLGWFDDAALKNGEELYDQQNNIRIKQIAKDSNKVTLAITIGELPCFRRDPDISVTPLTRSGAAGSTKNYEITIDNNDLNGCGPTEYSLEAILPSSSWTADLGNSKLSVNAQGSASKTFTVTSPRTTTSGEKALKVKVSARNGAFSTLEGLKYIVLEGTSVTPTPKPSLTPAAGTKTPTPKPTNTPTPQLTKAPTVKPSSIITPTKVPTNTPTPTKKPTNTPTLTPTPKPTGTPTPSPLPTDTLLNFTNIKLHGIGRGGDNTNPNLVGNLSPQNITRNLYIELYNPDGSLRAKQNGVIIYNSESGDFNGNVNISSLNLSGNFLLKIKSDKFLKKQYDGIVTIEKGKTIQVNSIALVSGDINNDGQLSIDDYKVIIDCYSDLAPAKNCNESGKKLSADLSDDGRVNQDDYNLFLRELSVQSEQ